MTFTLNSFKKYLEAASSPTTMSLNEFILLNIKDVVLFLLKRHKTFGIFLSRFIPSILLDLVVYKSEHQVDDRIKYMAAINKEKLVEPLKQWILDNYKIEEFYEEYGKTTSHNNIVLTGTVVELDNIHEYTGLMTTVLKERLSYKSTSVVICNNKIMVFFG